MEAAIETGIRPRKKRKTVFTFEELSPEAQERAIEENRDYDLDYKWYDYVYEDWKEKLGGKGFNDVEFFWSGFSCQGDGASFTATVDLNQYIKANTEGIIRGGIADIFTLRKIIKNDPSESDWEVETPLITQNGHYYHEMTMSYNLDWRGDVPPEVEKALERLGDCILEDARRLAKEFYKSLEAEHDYLTGDEATQEMMIANDCRFNRDGEQI